MKKLSFVLIGLIGLTPGLQASSSFSYFTAESKSLLCAVVRGIKHFYFPDYKHFPAIHTSASDQNNRSSSYPFDSDRDEELLLFSKPPKNLFRPIRERAPKRETVSQKTPYLSHFKGTRSNKITFFSF
jgi:hypothetical protein